VELVEELVLGNDENAAEEYLLAGPAHIKVDSQRRIYVADMYRGAISVFDHEGTFLTRIGGRGQGPGEISEITAMTVDQNDDLLVLDRMNNRLTRFSELGRQVESYPNPEPFRISAYWMWVLQDGTIALNYRIPTPNPDVDRDPELIHLYDAHFKARRESLVPAQDIWDLTQPFERTISSSPRAILFIPQEEGLLVVPQLYAGIIYRYTRKAEGWEKQSWQGKVPPYKPYQLLDVNAVQNNEKLRRVAFRKSGPEGRFAALTRSSSRGLVLK